MQNRIIIQQIAEKRLEEANILFQNNFYDGACYLAGYCIELALKATICRTLDSDTLFTSNAELVRPFKTHNLEALMLYAGLKNKYENDKLTNPTLMSSWSHITVSIKWSEEFRYQEIGIRNQADTQQLLNAVSTILQWIKNYW